MDILSLLIADTRPVNIAEVDGERYGLTQLATNKAVEALVCRLRVRPESETETGWHERTCHAADLIRQAGSTVIVPMIAKSYS